MNLLLLFTLLGFTPVAHADEIRAITVEYSTSTAPLVLNALAYKYGIDAEEFIKTAYCESHYNANAVGDHGNSYGVWQINLPSHPNISKEQALDPWWSTEWAAQQFAANKQRMWTCWRKLQNEKNIPTA